MCMNTGIIEEHTFAVFMVECFKHEVDRVRMPLGYTESLPTLWN